MCRPAAPSLDTVFAALADRTRRAGAARASFSCALSGPLGRLLALYFGWEGDAVFVAGVVAAENIALFEMVEDAAAEEEHDEEEGHEEGEDAHNVDPHVWLDPVYAQEEVDAILSGVLEADEANKESYEANAAVFNEKLAKHMRKNGHSH